MDRTQLQNKINEYQACLDKYRKDLQELDDHENMSTDLKVILKDVSEICVEEIYTPAGGSGAFGNDWDAETRYFYRFRINDQMYNMEYTHVDSNTFMGHRVRLNTHNIDRDEFITHHPYLEVCTNPDYLRMIYRMKHQYFNGNPTEIWSSINQICPNDIPFKIAMFLSMLVHTKQTKTLGPIYSKNTRHQST